MITEFMAANDGALRDGYGESSDWIEIHNSGDQPVDLTGYHLTDDPQRPNRWSFPSGTRLEPGGYLVVFASGKDTTDTAGGLHTNFRLNADGEYVALIDGQSQVVSQYGTSRESFPRQFSDVSYGTLQKDIETVLVSAESPAQLLIPRDDSLGSLWTQADFAPGTDWTRVTTGIGFDPPGVVVAEGTAILRLDVNDDDSGEPADLNTEAGWQTFSLANNGSTYNGITVTISPLGDIPLEGRDRSTPRDSPPSLTLDQIYDDFIFARSQTDETGLEVRIEGLVPGQEYLLTLWSYDSGSIGTRVARWFETSGPEAVDIEAEYSFDGRVLPSSDRDYTVSARLVASQHGDLRIQGVRNGGTSFAVFLNGLELVVPSIGSAITTNVQAEMKGVSASAFLRIPFTVDNVSDLDRLLLEMQYDGGFVAYVNGVEVARRGVADPPGTPPAVGSTAIGERSVDQALVPELIDITPRSNVLQEGVLNVLAIHGLNSSANHDNFLVAPKLTAIATASAAVRYFTQPTPGAPNTEPSFAGFVGDTQFSLDRGFYEGPQTVTITTSTPGASIAYTTDGSLPSPTQGTQVHAPTPNVPPAARVSFATTTLLRAMAYKPDYLPTNVDTQTYIFLEDVLRQDPTPGAGEPLYPTTWQARQYTADYQMDPEIVARWDDNNPDNQDFGIRQALKSLPTMSIVMDHEDLWGRRGIYPNATSQGSAWRRPGSLEYFDPNSGEEFQVNAGIQIHGGASRDNERTKKHSFRIVFKEEFDGPPELNYPLFRDSPLDRINTIVLKSFFTDGFPTRTITGRYSPLDSQYLRDTWIRDVRLAMKGLDAHSEYVHLYINGLYWGLYSPTERPDDAFMAAYLGGSREDWDVVKDFNELFRGNKTAWNAMFAVANRGLASDEAYQQIQGNNPDGTDNPDLPNLLDVDDLIDYMIQHLFSGAEDWPHHNWYAARDRKGPTTGFRFFTWDQEIILDGRFRDRTEVSDAFSPARLYARLRQNAEFRVRFGDRVYRHLFNDGALTVENAQRLWMRRADQIEQAIIAESARWGDAREGERRQIDSGRPTVTIPVMTVDLWRAERDNVRDNYLPRSHELTIRRFRADRLYPSIDPPTWNQRGGMVTSAFDIALQSESGQIYYTIDGSDPRLPGGAVSATARLYTGPFRLVEDATVTVRALNDNEWSARDQVLFEVDKVPADARNLRISEVHYHPAENPDAEFVELTNVGDRAISLTGVRFTAGIAFDFTGARRTSLRPDERLLVVKDIRVFQQTYPDETLPIAGQFRSGTLSDAGERIRLGAADGTVILDFVYSDGSEPGWTRLPDGFGPSLQIINPRGDYASPRNWRASAVAGGTPGRAEFVPGDSNLDGVFDSGDLVQVFRAGQYEDTLSNNSTWATGDWNGDGDFDTHDLVLAFQAAGYRAAGVAAADLKVLDAVLAEWDRLNDAAP